MPELPDIAVYVDCLRSRVEGAPLEKIRLASPFLLRSFEPTAASCEGRRVESIRRMGKRIVTELEGDIHLVLHLMIAGRLRWRPRGVAVPRKRGLAAFDFPTGSLLLTEASPKKRASLYIVRGREAAREHDRGGIEPLDMTLDEMRAVLKRENHTLKRSLTDPRLFSGIGNAYSDEILHHARLSPLTWTSRLDDDAMERLHASIREVLTRWCALLRDEVGEGFPDKVTAFRPEMAVHGKYGEPCPRCGGAVQRIRHAQNEMNYCPACQTGGKLLADRGLSRLLKGDWPRTLEELDEMRAERRGS